MRSIVALVALGLTAFASIADANALISPYVAHEKRLHVPPGWSWQRRHDSASVIPLRFALAQRNIDDIERHLMDVSHPQSSNYGKHWTPEQVAETFAPSYDTISAVRNWLIESGFESQRIRVTPTKSWIELNVTVEEAELLLHTEYGVYTHETGKEHIACDTYHLPSHIRRHVDFVTPTVHFDAKLAARAGSGSTEPARSIGSTSSGPKTTGQIGTIINELENCDEYITPDCLRALYGLVYDPVATDKNSIGIVEYTPQAYIQTDIDLFAMNFSTGLYGKSPYMVSIDGGYAQTEYTGFDYNGESDLDLQYSMTLVTPAQTVTLYQAGDMVEGASFNNFLDAIDGSYCTFEGGDDPTEDATYPDPYPGGYNGTLNCGTAAPTYVISTSYSYTEVDLTPFYTARQCAEYAKLGLMGVSVFYSSGDYGVAGNDGLCLTPEGTQAAEGRFFNPTFPATCPYITSVGATQVNPGATVLEPESACEQVIYSGGGFSNYFAIPDYQKDAVEYYLKTYPPDYAPQIYNSSGTSRAYPDISANGANYIVAIDGAFWQVYGTSCSSPVSASIFAMINDARLAAGKSPVGFINPSIYSADFAGLFNDITTGSNPGCNTTGFNATVGWDPATGLGTPNFPKLLAKWLTLP